MSDWCTCSDPKPVDITDETFVGLFYATPIERGLFKMCERCTRVIEPDDAGYALPEDFPDDGTQDFKDEDVVT